LDGLANRFQARDYISAGGLDVIQPDVCRAGGITESLKMAEVADLYGAACAPHVSIGSAIQFAATLHLARATPNLLIAEQNMVEGNPLGDPLVSAPVPRPHDGYLEPVEAPGLGVVMNEHAVRQMATRS
jgi:D-arabinonate dehydratase/D-galactarolactone cycloisomerase